MATWFCLPERKRERLDAGVEEFDFERPVLDRAGLADQLIQPLPGDGAVAIGVGVDAVVGAGRLAVQRHPEPHRLAVGIRPQHQMQVAGMEAIDDLAIRGATPAKVGAMPASIDRPLRANTKGNTSRMHGLRMVGIPPK